MKKKYVRKVIEGKKLGREIGFPTLNFNVGNLCKTCASGVYAVKVWIDKKIYLGALHYGPKFGSKKRTLEIHVIGLSKNLYGRYVTFSLVKKIREPMYFETVKDLQKQLLSDIKQIAKLRINLKK